MFGIHDVGLRTYLGAILPVAREMAPRCYVMITAECRCQWVVLFTTYTERAQACLPLDDTRFSNGTSQ